MMLHLTVFDSIQISGNILLPNLLRRINCLSFEALNSFEELHKTSLEVVYNGVPAMKVAISNHMQDLNSIFES